MLVYHERVSDCLTPIQQFFSYIMATVKEKMFLRKASNFNTIDMWRINI